MAGEVIPVWRSVAGGALIGAAAGLLMLVSGRVAGISGIVARSLQASFGKQAWRPVFLLGLVLPALFLGVGPVDWSASSSVLATAGVLVGFGTRLANGCTSGHGVCGLANLSPRSLLATATFVAVAIVTVATRHALSPP